MSIPESERLGHWHDDTARKCHCHEESIGELLSRGHLRTHRECQGHPGPHCICLLWQRSQMFHNDL
ncbi:unnamed protein product [Nyctereutes procyonoides]|uniref:(raccoon dog) hypothetical protein n=1 Tax=Nyctereutes procyonoides TaxID=34880 RepID=A0A811ZZ55_NYCPR|nr:unnamed protein product [Nyctereutes procyonoides]